MNATTKKYAKEHPEQVKASYTKWRAKNRERLNAYDKNWRNSHPGNVRSHHLKKYGITHEQWGLRFSEQGECCAVCKADKPGSKKGWHTDHCHKTGKVRGILCYGCNHALGDVKDNPATLRNLANYLESSE